MDKKKLKRIEQKLHQKIEAVFGAGSFMNCGFGYGVNCDGTPREGGCCLLGAVLLGNEYPPEGYPPEGHTRALASAATLLGITPQEAYELESGYMFGSKEYPRSDLVLLGAKMAELYYESHDPETQS